ncbi:MAG: amidohydrolase family protein [Christensenellales bacterium]|jgi:predicted TIM-barrel fold metal-dependent hydrolase
MIIDTHTHLLDGDWLCDFEAVPTADALIAAQERFGVCQMWMSSTGALADDFTRYNRLLYEVTKPFPKRFVNFASASLYFGDRAIDEIRRCIEEYGFGGIKVHYWMQGSTVHSKATHNLMELSIRHKVPVLFHDGTPPTSETLQIAYLAEQYPKATVILGHSGMFDTWRSAIDACNRLNNLYLCISASPIQDVEQICLKARPDRLLFGSDYGAAPSDDVFWNRFDAIEYGCRDSALKEKIYSGNALELMKTLQGGNV